MDHVIAEQRQDVSNRCYGATIRMRLTLIVAAHDAHASIARPVSAKLPEVAAFVRHEDEIPLDDPRHQMPVGFAAKPEPIHIGNNPGRELGPRPRMMCEGIHL